MYGGAQRSTHLDEGIIRPCVLIFDSLIPIHHMARDMWITGSPEINLLAQKYQLRFKTDGFKAAQLAGAEELQTE